MSDDNPSDSSPPRPQPIEPPIYPSPPIVRFPFDTAYHPDIQRPVSHSSLPELWQILASSGRPTTSTDDQLSSIGDQVKFDPKDELNVPEGTRWTVEDDIKLLELADRHPKTSSWGEIHTKFFTDGSYDARTPTALKAEYYRLRRKGESIETLKNKIDACPSPSGGSTTQQPGDTPWNIYGDRRLLEIKTKHPEYSWPAVSNRYNVTGRDPRSVNELKSRYQQLLEQGETFTSVSEKAISSPDKAWSQKHMRWTTEENSLLFELYDNGSSWKDIANSLPGRTEGACQLRVRNVRESSRR